MRRDSTLQTLQHALDRVAAALWPLLAGPSARPVPVPVPVRARTPRRRR
jgi:hypothetical protein